MAFHPYPQLIPSVFNLSGFGPPQSYLRFNLAMGRSLRFGSRPSDSFALFGLAFATASPHGLTSPLSTNSQAHSSKGTPSPHTKGEAPTDCRHTVSGSISSPPGVLFTFPSRYLSAIGHQGIFRLSRWSRQIHTGFLGPRATWDASLESTTFVYGGRTLYAEPFNALRL